MGIKFEKVGHEFKNIDGKSSFMAIKDINLDIDSKGEFIMICGKTGSGKSTLIQHMNALLLPTKGKVTIFDKEILIKKNKKLNQVRKRVGLVFQFAEYQLFEETVIKDIMFGPLNYGLNKKEALEKAKTAAKMCGVPEELWQKSPFRLSGGQVKRVAIAGILAMEPDILVLDEPTRGLDPQGKIETMELFERIHREFNKTIILITHDMDIVGQYAKRVIVLDEGYIVYDGKREDLFTNPLFQNFHLDYPVAMKLAMEINEKMGMKINTNVFTLQELINELERN